MSGSGTGAREGNDDPGSDGPLESLFAGLRAALSDRVELGDVPDSVGSRLRPVLERFFEQFQLVPKRDYDAHLVTLARLEETVSRLEARIAELERER